MLDRLVVVGRRSWAAPALSVLAFTLMACSPEPERRPPAGTGGGGGSGSPSSGTGGSGSPLTGGSTGTTGGSSGSPMTATGGRGGSSGMPGTGGATATGGAPGSMGTGGSSGMVRPPDAGAAMDARGGGAMDAGRADGSAPMRGDAGAGTAAAPVAFAPCAVCHGAAGEGAMLGPEIQHPVRDFATWVIRNGRTHPSYMMPMTAYPEAMLSTADLNQILTFLESPPKPTTGRGLFMDFCANCHGADGRGGVTMRNITIAPANTAAMYITNVRGGHHPGEFSNRAEFMPKWTAAQLSDAEIRLIFAFVTTGM